MPWTIDDVLKDDVIEKTEKTGVGFSFWLKGIPTEISVVLSVNPARGGFNFQLSHVIKTPCQTGPYYPGSTWGDYEAYALHMAVTAITQYYKQAVREGKKPSKEWLIPNA